VHRARGSPEKVGICGILGEGGETPKYPPPNVKFGTTGERTTKEAEDHSEVDVARVRPLSLKSPYLKNTGPLYVESPYLRSGLAKCIWPLSGKSTGFQKTV